MGLSGALALSLLHARCVCLWVTGLFSSFHISFRVSLYWGWSLCVCWADWRARTQQRKCACASESHGSPETLDTNVCKLVTVDSWASSISSDASVDELECQGSRDSRLSIFMCIYISVYVSLKPSLSSLSSAEHLKWVECRVSVYSCVQKSFCKF